MYKFCTVNVGQKEKAFGLIFSSCSRQAGIKQEIEGLFFFIVRIHQKCIPIINTRLFKGLSVNSPVTLKIFADRNCTDSSGLYTDGRACKSRYSPLQLLKGGLGGCALSDLSNHYPICLNMNKTKQS